MAAKLDYFQWIPITDSNPAMSGWYPLSGESGFWTIGYFSTGQQQWTPLVGVIDNVLPNPNQHAVVAWAQWPKGYRP